MPVTGFTNFCNQCFDLVNRIREYATQEVEPRMRAVRDNTSRVNPKRDVAIFSTYLTIVSWLQTFGKLNDTYDFQAVGAGARAILERYMDLKWFEKFSEREWEERFFAFPTVDRYMSAKKVVKHAKTSDTSSIDPSPYEALMAEACTKEPVDVLVSRIWGVKPSGEPKWPQFHWTGIRDVAVRAEAIGPACLDFYRELYPPMSWLVHAGPTAYLGRDFEEIERQVAWCYFFVFQQSRDSTIVAANLLGVTESCKDFVQTMNQFWEWCADALKTLRHRNE